VRRHPAVTHFPACGPAPPVFGKPASFPFSGTGAAPRQTPRQGRKNASFPLADIISYSPPAMQLPAGNMPSAPCRNCAFAFGVFAQKKHTFFKNTSRNGLRLTSKVMLCYTETKADRPRGTGRNPAGHLPPEPHGFGIYYREWRCSYGYHDHHQEVSSFG